MPCTLQDARTSLAEAQSVLCETQQRCNNMAATLSSQEQHAGSLRQQVCSTCQHTTCSDTSVLWPDCAGAALQVKAGQAAAAKLIAMEAHAQVVAGGPPVVLDASMLQPPPPRLHIDYAQCWCAVICRGWRRRLLTATAPCSGCMQQQHPASTRALPLRHSCTTR